MHMQTQHAGPDDASCCSASLGRSPKPRQAGQQANALIAERRSVHGSPVPRKSKGNRLAWHAIGAPTARGKHEIDRVAGRGDGVGGRT